MISTPRLASTGLLALTASVGLGFLTVDARSSDDRRPKPRNAEVRPPQTPMPADVIPSPLRPIAGSGSATALDLAIDPMLLDQARIAAELRGEVRIGNFPLPLGGSIALRLDVIDPFTDDARVLVTDARGRDTNLAVPTVLALGGEVEGDPDGDAFLCFSAAGVEGWIRADGIVWGVSDGLEGGPVKVHRLDALPPIAPELLENFCGTDLLDQPARPGIDPGPVQPDAASGGIAGSTSGGPCKRVRLAIETDQELLGLFSGDRVAATAYIATLTAAANHIYNRDFGVRLGLGYIRLWSEEDPWSAGGTGDELVAFREYWNQNMGSVQRDLAHFLSGRGLGGGVAWLPGLCGSYAYGLSANLAGSFPFPIENNAGQNWDLMVFTHELGHNVGCPHTHDIGVDNCAGGDCSVVPNATIMSYCHTCPGGLANMRMEFCPENILNVAQTFNSLGCDYEVTPETIALNDFMLVEESVPTVINVLGNDSGLACGAGNITSADTVSTNGGTIEVIPEWGPDGSAALLYTSPVGYTGYDFFDYTMRADSIFDSASVTVQIEGLLPPENPTGTTPGVLGRYYALDNPSVLPDFASLEPFGEQVWENIDAPSTNGEFADTGLADNVGVRWTGWIDVPAPGLWTFGTESDDGSRLWIANQPLVDNDGLHGMQERTGSIGLQAGRHAIMVDFFERGGGAGCIVRASGPGMPYDVIPASMWSYGESDAPSADLNGDGTVGGADLGLLLAGWGEPGPTDLDGDGTTNGADLGLLLAAWGEMP